MFAFNPAARAPMRVRLVRRLAPIVLIGFPLGFALLLLSPSPSAVFILGIVIELVSFALTLVIAFTGTNQIAAGIESGLDEFELSARLRAQSEAYRWFGAFVSVLMSLAFIAKLLGFAMTTGDDRYLGLFFWVTGYGAILPGWFLAKRLRDEPPEGVTACGGQPTESSC